MVILDRNLILFIRDLNGNCGAFPRARSDITRTAGDAGAVEDVLEAETDVVAAGAAEAEGLFRVEALAVVAHADAELVGKPVEADVYTGGAGVFEAIVKTFLDDAEEDELFVIANGVFVTFRRDGDGNRAGADDALDFFVDRLADIEAADLAGM